MGVSLATFTDGLDCHNVRNRLEKAVGRHLGPYDWPVDSRTFRLPADYTGWAGVAGGKQDPSDVEGQFHAEGPVLH